MNTRELLRQKRLAVKRHIDLNPTVTVVYRYPQIDNGFGKQVPDYSADPAEHVVKVRIAHPGRESGPFSAETNVAGVMPSSGRYVLTEYDADILQGDRIEDFKVGPVDDLTVYGGVAGKQATLITATDVD